MGDDGDYIGAARCSGPRYRVVLWRSSIRRDLAAQVVLEMPITAEGWVYKSRSGPSARPGEVPQDVWVGVVPMRTVAGEPVADDWVDPAVPLPVSVQRLRANHH